MIESCVCLSCGRRTYAAPGVLCPLCKRDRLVASAIASTPEATVKPPDHERYGANDPRRLSDRERLLARKLLEGVEL